jgi:surface antigen
MTKASLTISAALLALCTGTSGAFAQDYGDDCHHDNRAAGTVLGAIAGGVIGGAVSHGNGGAVVGGVILGGVAGNAIAGDVDCDDRPYAWHTYQMAFDGPVGERYDWEHNGHRGYIITHREYWDHDRLCRDFTVVTFHYDDEHRHDGTACRYEDGGWHFM